VWETISFRGKNRWAWLIRHSFSSLALLVLVRSDSTISYFVCMNSYQNMYLVCWSLARSIGKSSSDVSGLARLTVGELFLDEMTIYRETKEFTEFLGVFLETQYKRRFSYTYEYSSL
jgi:hypothetical protein